MNLSHFDTIRKYLDKNISIIDEMKKEIQIYGNPINFPINPANLRNVHRNREKTKQRGFYKILAKDEKQRIIEIC
jgi:peptide subunit release factor RF-3